MPEHETEHEHNHEHDHETEHDEEIGMTYGTTRTLWCRRKGQSLYFRVRFADGTETTYRSVRIGEA